MACVVVAVAVASAIDAPAAPSARAAARGGPTAGTQVYAWGDDGSDQLGPVSRSLPCTAACATFAPPPGTSVTTLAAGEAFSLALGGDGTVRAWGDDTYGHLGNGSADPLPPPGALPAFHTTPTLVLAQGPGNLAAVTALAIGPHHALAVGLVTAQPHIAVNPLCKAPCKLLPPDCAACLGFPDPSRFANPVEDVRTLTLSDPGQFAIRITGVTLGGPDAADFALSFGRRSATLIVQSAGIGGQAAIQLVGTNAFGVAKVTRAPLLWGAGGVLALLIVAAVALRATRRRTRAVGAATRAGG